MVQASCYQLVPDRKLGEYTLPEGWAIVAAGNRDSDRAATTRMPTPLRNRFVHIDFEVNVQEWSEWAIKANQTRSHRFHSIPTRAGERIYRVMRG